jgi:hypothetical protein
LPAPPKSNPGGFCHRVVRLGVEVHKAPSCRIELSKRLAFHDARAKFRHQGQQIPRLLPQLLLDYWEGGARIHRVERLESAWTPRDDKIVASDESGQRGNQPRAHKRRIAGAHEAALIASGAQPRVEPAQGVRIRHAILHDRRLEMPEGSRILHRHNELIRHRAQPLKQMLDERGVAPRQERLVPAHAPALAPSKNDPTHPTT